MKSLKKINSLFKNLEYKIKEKISKLEINNINLQQSNFFIRSLTWGLISTSGLTIIWLAFAYTEEIVIVKGKLEPIGDVKIINIPSGGVVKNILVKNGEEVFSDLSEREYFDRMQDYAVEFYLTGKNDPSEFTTKMTEEEPE